MAFIAHDSGSSAARRRRDRRLRSWLRHDRMTVRMELAAALHRSSFRGAGPETHDASQIQFIAELVDIPARNRDRYSTLSSGGFGGGDGFFGFSAFFALFRVVPELSASFSEPSMAKSSLPSRAPMPISTAFVNILTSARVQNNNTQHTTNNQHTNTTQQQHTTTHNTQHVNRTPSDSIISDAF